MYATIFSADPSTADERRREAHEPSIRVVVGRTGLACHRCCDTIFETHAYARSVIQHLTQHVDHLIGGCLTDDLMGLGTESADDVSVSVFDAGDVERFGTNTLVGKSRVSVHHLLYAHLTRS